MMRIARLRSGSACAMSAPAPKSFCCSAFAMCRGDSLSRQYPWAPRRAAKRRLLVRWGSRGVEVQYEDEREPA